MPYKIIPLTTDPNQNFKSTIPVDGKNLTLFFYLRYNQIAGYWWLSIGDSKNKILIDSLPLVTGDYPAANILGQYSYLNIGSCTIVKTGDLPSDIPDNTNLGTDYVMVWSDTIT